jgi:hypothetical protein
MQNLGAFFAEYRKKPGFAGLRCSLRSLHSALLRSATKSLQSLAHEPRAASLRGSPYASRPPLAWFTVKPGLAVLPPPKQHAQRAVSGANPLRTNRFRWAVCWPPIGFNLREAGARRGHNNACRIGRPVAS